MPTATANRPIRLLRLWRRQPPGTVLDSLPIGMATDMVERHRIAAWADAGAARAPKGLNDFRTRKAAHAVRSNAE